MSSLRVGDEGCRGVCRGAASCGSQNAGVWIRK